MSARDSIQTRFELIAAKAKLMSKTPHGWASDIQSSAREIREQADKIIEESKSFESGDR